MKNRVEFLPNLKAECDRVGVELRLLDAIVTVESSYDPWAMRYEGMIDLFKTPDKFAKMNQITESTELHLQRFSFGLGQIMGITARSMGYGGPLVQLCDVDLNIFWVCRLLKKLTEKYPNIEDVMASYNRGSVARVMDGSYKNQSYVDKVMRVYNSTCLTG